MSSVPDPKTWATGDDPATEKQKSFLQTLAAEKGASVDVDTIGKGPASAKIEELKDAPSKPETVTADGTPKDIVEKESKGQPISTSDDPATEKQQRYLAVLEGGSKDSEDAGLSKAEASEKISKLK